MGDNEKLEKSMDTVVAFFGTIILGAMALSFLIAIGYLLLG